MNFLRSFRSLRSIRPIQLSRVLPPQKVHGRLLKTNSAVRATGLRHLQRILSPMEAQTLYDQARTHGESYFQDNQNRNFTLTYNKTEGVYHLEGRVHD